VSCICLNCLTWLMISFTQEVQDHTHSSHSSHSVVKRNSVDNVSVRWKYGHLKHMVQCTHYKRFLQCNQTTISVVCTITNQLLKVKTYQIQVSLNHSVYS